MKKLVFLICFALLVLISQDETFACTCIEYNTPICASFSRSDAVFIGKVQRITHYSRNDNATVSLENVNSISSVDSNLIWLHIKVERRFKGVQENVVKVLTYANTSCDLEAEKGERWIFYASRDKSGNLGVGACSGTSQINRKDDAEYLNDVAAIAQDKNIESVNGFVFKELYTGEQISGAIINVVGNDFFTSTATNSQGLFSVRVPQAGKYKVRVTIPFKANIFQIPSGIESNLIENVEPTETKSVFAYQATVPQGQCQYSELGFFRLV